MTSKVNGFNTAAKNMKLKGGAVNLVAEFHGRGIDFGPAVHLPQGQLEQ